MENYSIKYCVTLNTKSEYLVFSEHQSFEDAEEKYGEVLGRLHGLHWCSRDNTNNWIYAQLERQYINEDGELLAFCVERESEYYYRDCLA